MSIHGSINESMNLRLEDNNGLCNTFPCPSVSSGICTPIVQAFCFLQNEFTYRVVYFDTLGNNWLVLVVWGCICRRRTMMEATVRPMHCPYL